MLAAIKAQEDAMLDMAILESEKERDNIQARKKRRKDEMLEGLKVPVRSSEEFQLSLLLHGLRAADGATNTSSSATAIAVEDSALGCGLMQLLSYMFDAAHDNDDLQKLCLEACESSSSELVVMDMAPVEDLLALRRAMVDFLLMESQTMKYYREECHPFLLYVAHKFDNHVCVAPLRPCILAYRERVRAAALTAKPDRLVARAILFPLLSHLSGCLHMLRNEKYLFERGLARIPTGGSSLPDIMRYRRLKPFMDLLRSKVEDDGFEFVEGNDGLELLDDADADVEELLSDSEEEDD